jgi:hypothetical protein
LLDDLKTQFVVAVKQQISGAPSGVFISQFERFGTEPLTVTKLSGRIPLTDAFGWKPSSFILETSEMPLRQTFVGLESEFTIDLMRDRKISGVVVRRSGGTVVPNLAKIFRSLLDFAAL